MLQTRRKSSKLSRNVPKCRKMSQNVHFRRIVVRTDLFIIACSYTLEPFSSDTMIAFIVFRIHNIFYFYGVLHPDAIDTLRLRANLQSCSQKNSNFKTPKVRE